MARYSTPEALVDPSILASILAAQGADTVRSRVRDILRGSSWPAKYSARTITDPLTEKWYGRESELEAALAADPSLAQEYEDAVDSGALTPMPPWASSAIDGITELVPAAQLVARIAQEAEQMLGIRRQGKQHDR